MSYFFAIDPGPSQSAITEWSTEHDRPSQIGEILPNKDVVDWLKRANGEQSQVIIEGVTNYGKFMGEPTRDTIRWSGRFEQVAEDFAMEVIYVPFRVVFVASLRPK